MSHKEIEDMNYLEKSVAIQYCWITFNLKRPDLAMGSSKKTGVKVKNNKVQELQEYEKNFVSKVKRNK